MPTAPESLPTRIRSSALRSRVAPPLELERPAGQLEPERRRLRVDPVGAADADRLPVLLGPCDDRPLRSSDPLEQQLTGGAT